VGETSQRELGRFLKDVERRAFKKTVYLVRDADAALDIVQDAMIRLSQKYADRPPEEWGPLFQRILANATTDWFRRQKTRTQWVQTLTDLQGSSADSEAEELSLDDLSTEELAHWESASDAFQRREVVEAIEEELSRLPPRQREAFLLRYWEDFDTQQTADVMNCSPGSVKTHCFRAVQALAKALRLRGITP
jgi:RNA polymerase sigma-70 factor, ECF subfamily